LHVTEVNKHRRTEEDFKRDIAAKKAATAPAPAANGKDAETVLAQHVETIRKLGKLRARALDRAWARRAVGEGVSIVADMVEIGRLLDECRNIVGHGNWLPWLEQHLAYSEDTARNFIRLYDLSKSRNFLDLNLPLSALYLLAAPSTPKKARDEIFKRAEHGEQVTVDDTKREIDKAKGKHPQATTPITSPEMAAATPLQGTEHKAADKSAETTEKPETKPESKPEPVKEPEPDRDESEDSYKPRSANSLQSALDGYRSDIRDHMAPLKQKDRRWFVEQFEKMLSDIEHEQNRADDIRKGKLVVIKSTIGEVVASAFADLQSLGEECREVVDNVSDNPGLSSTQRIQTMDDTANAIENLSEPNVPAEVADMEVTYDTAANGASSRGGRAGEIADMLRSCQEATKSVAKDFADELESLIDEIEGLEFPSMY
jgi:hypothetical protein